MKFVANLLIFTLLLMYNIAVAPNPSGHITYFAPGLRVDGFMARIVAPR
jgi:hypothetical protein